MTAALALRGITKTYPGVRACDAIDLDVRDGTVHAVVGENGAGKSTLFSIATGLVAPDAGTVHIGGAELGRGGAARARVLGLGMVHQHFLLVPTLTVAENVVLGREPGARGVFDRPAAEARVQATAGRWELHVDPRALAGRLSVGEQQRVEIVRVLDAGARIIVLDEPTAVLAPAETADLFRILRELTAAGHAIVFISHRLPEVMEIADEITVLRGGRVTARLPRGAATESRLAEAIVGRVPAPGGGPAVRPAPGAVRLVVRDAVTAGAQGGLRGVSFDVRAGEILGIAGVEGNGQRALQRLLLGLEAVPPGCIRVDGEDWSGAGVAARRRRGLGYVSEDRIHEGLIPEMSLAENLWLAAPSADRLRARDWLRPGAARAAAGRDLAAAGVRPADPAAEAAALSGGNQQKVVLARELGTSPRVLVLAQPTRGVDIGGIEYLHARIRAARDAGAAILLISADLAEVVALADRIGVLYGGRLRGPFPAAEATAERLGRLLTGAEDAA